MFQEFTTCITSVLFWHGYTSVSIIHIFIIYIYQLFQWHWDSYTVYPKKYAHGFCFAVLCCGYTLTGFPISIRLTSLALGQSNDCPSASKANLMNMDKYFMWIHYEWLHNHNKAKHNKTVCIFLGIYCSVTPVVCLLFLYSYEQELIMQLQQNNSQYGIYTISWDRWVSARNLE